MKNLKWLYIATLLSLSPISSNAQSDYIIDISTEPSVISKTEEFSIYIKTNQPLDSVIIQHPKGNFPTIVTLNGNNLYELNQITFYDNGTMGDLIPNDQIFTRSGFELTYPNTLKVLDQTIFKQENVIYYYNGNQNTESLKLNTCIASYDATMVPKSNITVVNDSVQYSDLTINVIRKAKWGESPFPKAEYYKSSKLFKEIFCDDFFILVQSSTNNSRPNVAASASFGPSSNFTEGIGKNIYDGQYPFVGVYTVYWSRGANTAANHELLHKWAAIQDLYGKTSTGEGLTSFGHWGWIQMNTSGLKGPTSFEFLSYESINKDTLSVRRNLNNGGLPYWSNLELYMAGLLPIDSVPFPITYIKNVNLISSASANPVILTGKVVHVSKNDWISVVGERNPEFGPSVYNTVHVVYSDELLTSGQLSYFDEGVRLLTSKDPNSSHFSTFKATKGLVEVKSDIRRIIRSEIDIQICEGESYEGYSESGTYQDVLTSENGCDSIRILNLIVLPKTDPDCIGTIAKDIKISRRIIIYPNPSQNYITIKSGGLKIEQITIRDINGLMIKNGFLDDKKEIDVSNLKDGVFFIQLLINNQIYTKKLIVLH